MQPKTFSEFNIKTTIKAFSGDKIRIDKILNVPIVISDFKIEPSKYQDKGSGLRLVLQIIYNEAYRIVFTGSTVLMDAIKQVPKDGFPFLTTIIKENESFRFT